MTNVLIVDDHPMVARYTKNEVVILRPGAVISLARDLKEAEGLIAEVGAPDYLLLDLMLPDCDGLSGLARLRRLTPRSVFGIITGETSPAVMRNCFALGARGYITKSTGADEFSSALKKLFQNGFFYPTQAAEPLLLPPTIRLTPREVEVLQALALGKQNKQLAPLLNISESTFKTYLRNIYEKLRVQTRVQAVRRGVELGLIDSTRRR